jgi:error-prone DNA polymerase
MGEAFKTALFGSTMMLVTGYIQREGEVVHLIARYLADLPPLLATVGCRDIALRAPRQPGDEIRNGGRNLDHWCVIL